MRLFFCSLLSLDGLQAPFRRHSRKAPRQLAYISLSDWTRRPPLPPLLTVYCRKRKIRHEPKYGALDVLSAVALGALDRVLRLRFICVHEQGHRRHRAESASATC